MKHMILSFKMKGDVISDHFLMLWFQKDSLDTVGFRTFRGVGAYLIFVTDTTDGECVISFQIEREKLAFYCITI